MLSKKLFKNKWFWIIIVVALIIVVYLVTQMGKSKVTYTTEAAKRGSIVQTVTATGEVQSATEMNLNFKNSGWLQRIEVKVGDSVKAGQALAQLQNSSLAAAVLAAQANLTKALAGTAVEDIKIYQESVAKEQTDLDTLQIKRDSELITLRDKAIDVLNNAVFDASVSLNTVYKYLIDTSNTNNLTVTQASLYNAIASQYGNTLSQLNKSKTLVTAASSSRLDADIILALDNLKSTLNDLTGLLNNAFAVADSIIINSTFTQTTKDTIKTDFTTEQGISNTNLTALQTAKSNLINTEADYENRLRTKQASLAYAQAQLAQKQAPPKQYDIDYYRAQLAQAQANLGDTYLRAPIDGVITKKNYEVGDQTSAATSVLTMMSNSKLEIEVNIPESDVAKVKIDQPVDITLDAFGEDVTFKGKITFIDPAATKISDVVYYKTKVTFNDKIEQVKPGMTANLTIITAQKENVLTTLQRAVKSKNGNKTVQVLVKGQLQEKEVQLGLWGDEGLVEIIGGLNEGEQVITFIKTK